MRQAARLLGCPVDEVGDLAGRDVVHKHGSDASVGPWIFASVLLVVVFGGALGWVVYSGGPTPVIPTQPVTPVTPVTPVQPTQPRQGIDLKVLPPDPPLFP